MTIDSRGLTQTVAPECVVLPLTVVLHKEFHPLETTPVGFVEVLLFGLHDNLLRGCFIHFYYLRLRQMDGHGLQCPIEQIHIQETEQIEIDQ